MTLLTLLTLPAFASASITVALTEPAPEPGDTVTVEVRWTNPASIPIRIPATWTEGLRLWAWHVPPGEKPEPQKIEREADMSITQARRMEWITVPPGESVSHILPLGLEECAAGCPGGSYFGQVNLSWGIIDGMKDDQFLPEGQVPFGFDVRLPTVAITADAGVTAVISDVSAPEADGTVAVAVGLHNGTEAPLWVAGPTHWLGACLLVHKKGEQKVLASVLEDAPQVLTEEGMVLMQPGGAMEIPVRCTAIAAPKLPRKSEIAVSIKPAAPFFAIETHEDRQVFTGEIASDNQPVPRK